MNVLRADTIAALATPPGRSSVAMFRVSGPAAFDICDGILRQRQRSACYATQTLHRALVVDGNDTIDDVLVAIFHAPRSYTGENVVEITCHGGAAPVRNILRLLLAGGARMADPGEFTLRAFLNGKLDLAQAEAVCDAIDARTDEGHRLARAQGAGRLSTEVGAIRNALLGIVARIEATIDFPEDVGAFPGEWCADELTEAAVKLDRLIATADRGMLYRDGVSVVLAGKPNAGKSSLLNALLRADRAIVTPIPGTTRDVIEESISIRGIPARLIDTAGLREAVDEIERLGVERTKQSLACADIVLWVKDASDHDNNGLLKIGSTAPCLVVWNKIDLLPADKRAGFDGIRVSALTGEGIEALEGRIADIALGQAGGGTLQTYEIHDGAIITHARHKQALIQARDALSRAQSTRESDMPLDFLSIEVQSALSAAGLVTGETAPQDIVSEIFSKFCIGK